MADTALAGDWTTLLLDVVVPNLAIVFNLLYSLSLWNDAGAAMLDAKKEGGFSKKSVLPFFCTATCTAIGFLYGCLLYEKTIIIANVVPATVSAIASVKFYGVCENKPQARRIAALLFLYVSLSSVIALLIQDVEISRTFFGVVGNITSYAMLTAPIADLMSATRTGSLKRVSFKSALVNILNCITWLVYGLRLGVIFVWMPSVVGIAVNIWALMLFVLFTPCRTLRHSQ